MLDYIKLSIKWNTSAIICLIFWFLKVYYQNLT